MFTRQTQHIKWLIVIALIFFVAGCNNDNLNQGEDITTDHADMGVTPDTTAVVDTQGNTDSVAAPFMIKGSFASGQSQVTKVLILTNGSNESASTYRHVDVASNGAFSLTADTNTPLGLVLVDSADHVAGHISFGNGIDVLPLAKRRLDSASIDLQSITLDHEIGTPAHNPIGAEIPLTAAEQTLVATYGNFLPLAQKNLDVDGNGTIDYFEGKRYLLGMIVEFNNNAPVDVATPAEATLSTWKMILSINEVLVTSPLPTFSIPTVPVALNTWLYRSDNNSSLYFSEDSNITPVPFGDYLISYQEAALTFREMPAYSEANAPVPFDFTIHARGTILDKVTCTWKLRDGTVVDPALMMERITFQNGKLKSHYAGDNVWEFTSQEGEMTVEPYPNTGDYSLGFSDYFGRGFIYYFKNVPLVQVH